MWQEKRWLVRETDEGKAAIIADSLAISDVVAKILVSRGIDTQKAAAEFLYAGSQPFHAPRLLQDMDKAVQRICTAIAGKEKITIYGDYDVDGITATCILKLFFRNFGIEVDYYIPLRQTEGYGINFDALAKIAAGGSSLVITVDCGVSSAQEIAAAPSGLDVIITDHHTPPAVLPAAFAVINPKRNDCQYPYKELAGVGVAFKLCQALWQKLKNTDDVYLENIELAALGTIADVVALTGENREIVRQGLLAVNEKRNPGINELIKVAGLAEKKITAGHIGFMLAPRLNAVGRLDNARQGVELLTTADSDFAASLAQELDSANQHRQAIEKDILVQAERMLAEQGPLREVIVLACEGWHIGVIGIVASRLVEKYYRPVVMISIGEDICKASCRSIAAFDMYAALQSVQALLAAYGGHQQAAGFSIKKENIALLREQLLAYAQATLSKEDYIPVQRIDVVMDNFSRLDESLLQELSCLEPCGMGNPAPVLAVQDVAVKSIYSMGADGKHLKFTAEKDGKSLQAIFWQKSELKNTLYDGIHVDLAFAPELNEWRNERKINLRLLDVRQDRLLVDLRHEHKAAQKTILQNILKEQTNAFVYCFAEDKAGFLPDHILQPDSLPTTNHESIIFFRPPYLLLADERWWQAVKKTSIKKIYLLYNKDDVQEIAQSLAIDEQLRELYKVIRSTDKASIHKLRLVCGKLEENKLQSFLDILEEIGVITQHAGEIALLPVSKGEKIPLSASATYTKLFNEQKAAKMQLHKCVEMSTSEFSSMFFE